MSDLSIDSTSSSKTQDNSLIYLIIIVIIIIIIVWFISNHNYEKFETINYEIPHHNEEHYYAPNYETTLEHETYPNFVNTTVGPKQSEGLINYPYIAPEYTDINQDINNGSVNLMTADDRTVYLMNEYAKQNATINENISCNLLGLNTDEMNDYQKKNYSLYKHQITCPKKPFMDTAGMKKCNLDQDSNCNNIFTSDYNNPDTNALSYYKMLENNKKECVSCNNKPILNNLNRQQNGYGLEHSNQLYNELPEDIRKQDQERMYNKEISEANVSNYVNFENNVYQNSIGETSVDKMAEIRTCATGTCGLKSYGTSIANVYDKLVSTPYYTDRNSCKPDSITGVLDDSAYTDNYAPI